MNYAPHTLTTNMDLLGIPKGSRLVYTSDTNDRLTYQHGSRTFELSLEDATNGTYFSMSVPANESLFARLWNECRVSCVFLALTTALALFVDMTHALPQLPPGMATIGALVAIAYWVGSAVLIRKITKRQLNRWETAGLLFTALVIYFMIGGATGGPVLLGWPDYFGIFAAIQALRLPK